MPQPSIPDAEQGDCEVPRPRGSASLTLHAAAIAAAAHEAEHGGGRSSCYSQWENNEGAQFPGHAARESSDDEEDDGVWQEALHETWGRLAPEVRSQKALIPTLSGANPSRL